MSPAIKLLAELESVLHGLDEKEIHPEDRIFICVHVLKRLGFPEHYTSRTTVEGLLRSSADDELVEWRRSNHREDAVLVR